MLHTFYLTQPTQLHDLFFSCTTDRALTATLPVVLCTQQQEAARVAGTPCGTITFHWGASFASADLAAQAATFKLDNGEEHTEKVGGVILRVSCWHPGGAFCSAVRTSSCAPVCTDFCVAAPTR